MPLPFVVVWRVKPEFTDLTSMLAPAITAPLTSVIVPLIWPVSVCAHKPAGPAIRGSSKAPVTNEDLLRFIFPLLEERADDKAFKTIPIHFFILTIPLI